MKVKCAWCEHEGRSVGGDEVEPLENEAETHGVCREHRRQWLESLGLRALPPPTGEDPPPS